MIHLFRCKPSHQNFSGTWDTTLLSRGDTSSGGSPTDNPEGTAISRAKVIEWLLDADSRQTETQTEPGDLCIPDKGGSFDSESLPSGSESELAFF